MFLMHVRSYMELWLVHQPGMLLVHNVLLVRFCSGKLCPCAHLPGDKVTICMLTHTCVCTHTNSSGVLKWPSAITRLSTHFTCGLMSDWWFANIQYGHTWHWMSIYIILRPSIFKKALPMYSLLLIPFRQLSCTQLLSKMLCQKYPLANALSANALL